MEIYEPKGIALWISVVNPASAEVATNLANRTDATGHEVLNRRLQAFH